MRAVQHAGFVEPRPRRAGEEHRDERDDERDEETTGDQAQRALHARMITRSWTKRRDAGMVTSMSSMPAELSRFLPVDRVGAVQSFEPIPTGPSGARVYAVTTERGELILKVPSNTEHAAGWEQQLRVQRRAADRGVAPEILHADEHAHAIVSRRVGGAALRFALADPGQRDVALAGVIAQLRALHAVDATGVEEGDPIARTRGVHAAQVARPGFPAFARNIDPVLDTIAAALDRDRRRVVSHNDVNPTNVLWDGSRAWLVDWEVAGLSHPFYDFAALAMFIRLEDEPAHALLAMQEQRTVTPDERATFDLLRRLAALLCGLTFLSLMPDLEALPTTPPTLADVYAELRAGRLSFADARGMGAFGSALLRNGLGA